MRKTLVLLALLATSVEAATIRVELDRNEATLQEQILMQVAIEGAPGGARPELPALPDFEVHPQGTMQSTQIVNGRVSQSLIFRYVLVPTREGTFQIGAVRLDAPGVTAQSEPVTVRITSAPADRSVFVSASVSDSRPYVGQQVVYTFRFYRRVLVDNARLEPIDVPGALVESLEAGKEFQTTVDGQAYAVQEVRLALFPQRAGTLEIPPTKLTCEVLVRSNRRGAFDMFGATTERRPRVLKTDAIRLEVRALPAAPTGWSGLVGDFRVATTTSRPTLAVGESTTLEIKVSGRGNAMAIAEPQLDLTGFKVYDEQPKSSLDRTGRELSGQKTYRKALVPLQAGIVPVPPATLIVFDPTSGSYKTVQSEAIALEVTARDGTEELAATVAGGSTAGKVEVRILGEDIMPPSRDPRAVTPAPAPVWFWLGLLLPAGGYGALWLWLRRRRRFAADAGLRRRRDARRTLQRNLADLSPLEPRARAVAASRALRTFVGDLAGFEGGAATGAEISERLESSGVGAELAAELRATLERFDAAGYGAAPVEGAVELVDALAERLAAAIKRGSWR